MSDTATPATDAMEAVVQADQMTWPDFLTDRPIGHHEAREIANRLIASHFRNGDKEGARVSIPAQPDRDDDLLMLAYIRQQEAAHRLAHTPVSPPREPSGAMVEAARRALKPFADRVFNDNGDLTINGAPFTHDEIADAYFAHKALTAPGPASAGDARERAFRWRDRQAYDSLTHRLVTEAIEETLRIGGIEQLAASRSCEQMAQRLQDHMEQHHGVCLKASEWDAAIRALNTPDSLE